MMIEKPLYSVTMFLLIGLAILVGVIIACWEIAKNLL
jgi:hypothetical protein